MTSSYGSFYAAPKKRRPPVFLIALLALFVAGGGAIIWLETRPVEAEPAGEQELQAQEPADPVQPDGLAPVVQPKDETDLRRENAELREENERLEGLLASTEVDAAQLAELQQEVLGLRAEVERYRSGLKAAVGELNMQRYTAGPPPPPAAAAGPAPRTPASGPEELDRWVFARDPYAVMNPDAAIVEGSVHNTNREPVRGYVVLTVFANGRDVGGDRIRLTIPPKTVQEYSMTVKGTFPTGPAYEVTAAWQGE